MESVLGEQEVSQYLFFDPERPLPPYTLYICSEKSGRWGIVPNLAPCGRWRLEDEIKRAKRHASGKPQFWYEVAERETGKTVFTTRVELNTVDAIL